jgi:hypothetical protein
MLLALSRSVAEFEPRRHLADGGSTTRPAGLEEVARAFRLSTRPAQTRKPGGGACDTHNRTQLYSKCRCACRRHQRCHCGERRLRNVAVFWAALGPAAAGLYMVTWGAGGQAQWRARINQVWSPLSGPSSPKRRPLRRFPPRCQSRSRQYRQFRAGHAGMRRAAAIPRSAGKPRTFCLPPARNKVLGA